MPNIGATTLVKLITEYNQNLDKYEQRTPKVGTLDAFRKDTAMIGGGSGIISSQERANIEMSGYAPNGTAIPVIDNQDITIATTGSTTCEATTEAGDTALVDITYNTLSFDLRIPVGDYEYNYVGLESALARAIKARRDAVMLALNQLCLTQLEADKNQIIAPHTLGYWADGGSVFQVGAANQDDYFNYLRMAFASMNFEGPFRYIGNPAAYAQIVNKQFAQGTGNSVNTQYQFTGDPSIDGELSNTNVLGADFDWNLDNQLVNGAGINNTAFCFPTGSTALLSSVDKGIYPETGEIERGIAGKYSTVTLPGLADMKFGLRLQTECEDGARTQISGGPLAGPVDKWQFESRFAVITPYNSDPLTREGSINKFEVIP